ncbi:hypothetical protein DNTS_022181 [Danionella cerebrum]|uniref:Coiled-coil domain-containing protein 169 n=1 Tax=Danionella cerebrum TaxID=2873325 RepID=A0A553QLT8_9TELE|nr:hypothetical protein DNTS_022181 [Danionella translucida]
METSSCRKMTETDKPGASLIMGDNDAKSLKLSKIKADIEEEREVKDMLQDSVSDLRSTLADLEKRLRNVDGEENEWRTRYETQLELNEQLENQIRVVQERLETLCSDPTDRLASIRVYDQMSEDVLRKRLNMLTTEKSSLQSQLMDFQMRIVQERKTYLKAYEERRAYLAEIAKLPSTVDLSRKQQMAGSGRATLAPDKTRGVLELKPRSNMMKKPAAHSRLPRLKH